MATLLDEAIKASNSDTAKMPKYLPLSTAQKLETVSSINQKQKIDLPEYKVGTLERTFTGAATAAASMLSDTAPSLQLLNEEVQLGLGGYFGAKEEFINQKKANIVTLQRNLAAQQRNRMQGISQETADSWAFNIGSGVTNFALMYATGGGASLGAKALLGVGAKTAAKVGATAGILSAVPLENVEQQSDRIKFDEQGNVDATNITPEWARKTAGGTTAYLVGMGILEAKFGIFKNLSQWQKPIPFKNKLLKNLSVPATTALKSFINEGGTEGLQSLLSSGIQLAEGNITLADMPDRLQQAWKEAIIGGLLGGTVGTAVGINQAHTVKQGLTEMVQPVLQDPELTEQVVNAIYDSGTAEMTNVISRELELSSELNNKHGAIYDTMQGAIYDAINNAGAFEGVSEAEIAQYVSDTSKMFANQVLAEANKRGVSIDGVLKASDIKFENGKIYMKAGKEIIAENTVTEENPEALKGSIEINVNEQGEETTLNLEENEAVKRGLSKETAQKQVNKLQKGKEYRINNAARVTFTGNYNEEGMPIFINAKGNEQAYSLTNVFDEIAPVKMDENGQTKLFQDNITPDTKLYQAAYHGTPYRFDEFSLENIGTGEGAQAHGWGLYFAGNKNVSEGYRQKLLLNGSFGTKYDIKINGKPADAGIRSYIINNFSTRAINNIMENPASFNEEIKDYVETIKLDIERSDKWLQTWRDAIDFIEKNPKISITEFNKNIKKEDAYRFKYIIQDAKNKAKEEGRKTTVKDIQAATKEFLQPHQERIDKEREQLKKLSEIKNLEIKQSEGQLFEVDIPDDDVLLDEDKMFSEQPKTVQEAIKKLYEENWEKYENNNATTKLAEIIYTDNTSKKYVDNLSYKEGRSIYQYISDMVGSDKNASELLNEYGVKGITYDGLRDGRCYVIFDDKAVKVLEKYYQLKNTPKQPKIFKGAFDVSAKAIELFKDADYSTLPHELAHFWLDNMWGYYRSGKASEAYTNNFQGVLNWLGVKEGQINLTRNQQEKFARGYEKYLLNGYSPNGLIQGAFDDYDKWLQKVYNDARELKVKLTPDAIEFFDTMTTGELPEYDVPETQAQIREQNIEQINKDIETARKFVVEKQAEYNNFDGGNVITKNTVPVTTEGEKKQSKAYTNQASILGIAEELNYNEANIAEQNKLASEYVKNNLDVARQIVNGEKEAPKNILKNAIYNAYLKEMLAIGDNEAYVNALKNQSLELTRAGQEIASQRGAIENIFDSGYWIRRIENLKKMKLAAQKFGGVTGQETEQALSKMNDFIKNKVDAVMPEFMDATTEEQKVIAEKLSKEIAAEFKVKPDTKLYQTMYEPSEVRTRTNAYNYIYKYINSALGLDLTKAQYNEIIAKTMAIQKSIETTRNRNGNPSALFFRNISEMENYANSIEPSPALAILTSTVGRGNMLFSPKTIALNIESNTINFITEAITRRMQSGAVNMAVDPKAIKDYLAYSREVFNTSGYQVSSMPSLDPTTQILSEKMTTTAGNRAVDKLGRFFEQTIFKYGLGAPDLFFKDMTFVDTANLLATKEAKGDTKKATELFKDICLIEPKTAKGKELREIAINEALVATYQNKGRTSDLALGIRNAINKASGSANLGDMLSPFVKTPANVIGLGFDYSMGGLVALKNIQTIYNDIQQGTFTETTRKSLRSLARNGIGFAAAMMIAGLIDDDDYIPEYALLDAKERELVKMKGGVFNSVKIGDKYISLDYFGPLAMPLVSYLNARRGNDIKDKAWNYFQGSAYQALKLPVIGDLKSLLEGTGRTLTKDINENIKMAQDAAIDFVSSRAIPAIVTDVAKMTDEYERETNNNAINRLKSKVPILREELPMQYNYGTGQPRETQNPVSQLFAGARIKEEVSSSVIRELDKLSKKNTEEKINIAKVTKAGKLSSLSDEKKNKVEKEFAKLYAQNVGALIKTPQYKVLDDNEKIKNINKIRTLITDKLKEDYGLNDKTKKPRTKRIVNKNNIQL